jgi:chitinase
VKILLVIIFYTIIFSLNAQENRFKRIAYCTGSAASIKQYPIIKLTHLIYSFLKVQNDTLTFVNEVQKQTVQELVDLKKTYPNLKIMVSVGGWGGCGFCSPLFADSGHRINFARTTVALFKKYGIDGLDLDWEYPAIEGYPGHLFSKSDKNNFTQLLTALRNEMGSSFILSFAAGGFEQYVKESIDWPAITPIVDFINLMTYDLVGGYSTVTGHHTAFNNYKPGQESVQQCVSRLLNKKVPAKKLIIGAAFYARVWENVSDTNHGLFQTGKFKQGVAYKDFQSYFTDSSGFVQYWDKKSKAPFAYQKEKKLFASFDNERSIGLKSLFVKKKKLGGIMFWELGQDKITDGLVSVMEKILKE